MTVTETIPLLQSDVRILFLELSKRLICLKIKVACTYFYFMIHMYHSSLSDLCLHCNMVMSAPTIDEIELEMDGCIECLNTCNLKQCIYVFIIDRNEVEVLTPGQSDEQRVLLLRDLMQMYGSDVLHVVYGYVHDRHQAEDISQEVFIKVYDHLHTFRQDSSYRTWILRIAINTAKDFLRKKARRPEEFNDVPHAAADGTVEGHVLQQLESQELWEAVSKLPITYREVVWLHYGKDLSMDEITNLLGLSLSAVKTRLYRGREMLRKTWEGSVDRESSGR